MTRTCCSSTTTNCTEISPPASTGSRGSWGVDLTPEERAAVIERTGFAAMKRDGAKFEPPRLSPLAKEETMVRAGGSPKDKLMTPELARLIDDHCRAELRALGCDFDYDAAFCRG